jgi:hypothetical protein
MTKPACLITSDARKTNFLVDDANTPLHRRAIGSVTPTGGDDDSAMAGVATHLVGAAVATQDQTPLVLTGGVLTLADTLAAGIDDAVVALTVHLTTSSPASAFVARIGTEEILVTAGFGTAAWTIERGVNGTTPASHAEDAAVSVVVVEPLIVNAAGALVIASHLAGDAVTATEPLVLVGVVDGAGDVTPLLDRINADVSILTSSARTTTQTQADQTNLWHRGIRIVLDVTVNGAGGSITLEVDAKDAVSGKYVPMLTGAAVTDVRTVSYLVYPSATPAANLAASDSLPLTWRIVVTANNANAVTYSVGASLLV